jgi:anaerobic selenocysteine-containing dehydrogenase
VRVRGDVHDPVSAGFVCPKGSLLPALDADTDRVRQPLVRGNGTFQPASWQTAFDVVTERLVEVIERHGRNAVATYAGNPHAYSLGAYLYWPQFVYALGTKNRYSAGSLDAWPKQVASQLLFGHQANLTVPDLDRTDLLVILGANPVVSGGSLASAPNWPKKLRGLVGRGGRVVVIDPRTTETARLATDHRRIRPGADALLLLAVASHLFDHQLVDLGRAAGLVRGLGAVQRFVEPYTPDAVAAACGIDAAWIRALAEDLARTPRSAVYGRIGVCLQELGLVASWAVDLVNILTGSLDREGGVMFARPATGVPALRTPRGRPPALGRWCSRVSGHPEVFGELPAVALSEEILTAGPGQVRALVTHSGNPVLSSPEGDKLGRALNDLDFMVSVDVYVNETTRHADVILPSAPLLTRPTYPLITSGFAMRSYAKFSPRFAEPGPNDLDDDEILVRLISIVSPTGANPEDIRTAILLRAVRGYTSDSASPLCGRDPHELVSALHGATDPERLLDLQLRMGPFGNEFGTRGGIDLAQLQQAPHGIDFGPMVSQLPDVIRTGDGMIDLLPDQVASQRVQIDRVLAEASGGQMRLVGRRQLQSNNSWMHNLPRLVSGRNRCTAQLNPLDARARRLDDGDRVRLTSSVGSIIVDVEITDDVMPGVVCVPHGWGHAETSLSVARHVGGMSVNDILSTRRIDAGTGNAALNGACVEVEKVGPAGD